jgi:hypothetical protein
LTNSEACLADSFFIPADRIRIQCSKDAIEDLMAGRKTIRELIKTKKVQVMGTYRNILKIESVFLLSRSFTLENSATPH